MKKRILALLLVLALTLGMASMTAFAETQSSVAKVVLSSGTETEYTVLEDAIRAAHTYNQAHDYSEDNQAWVVLLRNIEASELDCLNKSWDDSTETKEYPCANGVTILMNEKTCTGNITLALGNSVSIRNGKIVGSITSNCMNLEMMDVVVTGDVTATRGYLGIYMDWDRYSALEEAYANGDISDDAFNAAFQEIVSSVGGQVRLWASTQIVEEHYDEEKDIYYYPTKIEANICGDTAIGGNVMLTGKGENIDLTLCDVDLGANTIFDNTDCETGTNIPGNSTKADIKINRTILNGTRGEVAYFKNYLASYPDELYCSLTFTNGSGSGFEWNGIDVRVGKGQSIVTRTTSDLASNLAKRLIIFTGAWMDGATMEDVSYYKEGSTMYEIPRYAYIEWDEANSVWYVFNAKYTADQEVTVIDGETGTSRTEIWQHYGDKFDENAVDSVVKDSTITFYYAQTYTLESHWIDTLNRKNVKIELAGLYKDSTRFKFETTDGEPLILTSEGTLEFTNTSSAVLGDVNGDGAVTARDAVLVLKYLVGLRTCADDQIARMDVDGSGKPSTIDAVYLLRYVAGLIEEFPKQK